MRNEYLLPTPALYLLLKPFSPPMLKIGVLDEMNTTKTLLKRSLKGLCDFSD
ncbi:hypothetical protein OK016_20415 [Vibrio chagasii]|nr:hypothetical protein [Vibrio chagasii]